MERERKKVVRKSKRQYLPLFHSVNRTLLGLKEQIGWSQTKRYGIMPTKGSINIHGSSWYPGLLEIYFLVVLLPDRYGILVQMTII